MELQITDQFMRHVRLPRALITISTSMTFLKPWSASYDIVSVKLVYTIHHYIETREMRQPSVFLKKKKG